MMIFLYWLGIAAMVFGVFLLLGGFGSFGSSGVKDGRTRTGYKDNQVPDPGNPVQGCLCLIIGIVLLVGGYITFEEGGGWDGAGNCPKGESTKHFCKE